MGASSLTGSCSFAYRPSRWGVVILILAGGVFAELFAHSATHNDRSLIIDGLIRLSPQNATYFYWVMAVLGIAIMVAGFGALVARVSNVQELTLTNESLSAAKWMWSRWPTVVPYTSIRSITPMQIKGHEYLRIIHAGGKFNILASWFESKYAYYEACEEISRRLQTTPKRQAA